MKKVLLTFGLFFAVILSSVAADKWYVRKDNIVDPTPANKNYRTISEAISDTSRVVPGDTVIVYDGTYPEQVRFGNKRVVLGSRFLVNGNRSHVEKTIIDGDGLIQNNDNNDAIVASYGYTDNPSDLQIVGLTVINARRWAMAVFGGTVRNCVIRSSGTNGYYLVRAANAVFDGCTFQGNRGSALFGAMSFFGGPADNKSVILRNAVFRENILDNSTGDNCIIYSGYSQDLYVQNTLFYKNNGGNIFSLGGNGGNTGASASQNDSTFIVNCLVYDNKSNVATIRSYERADGGTYYFLNNIIFNNEGSSPFAGSRYFSYRGTGNKFHIGFFNNYIPIEMSRESQQDLSTNATYTLRNHYGSTNRIIFRDTANADYRLADSSFGLGMGIDTLKVVPLRDFNDSLRPSPAGSKVDLGPYENTSAFSTPRLLRAAPGRNKAYLSWSVGHPTYDSVQVFRSTDSLGTYAQIGNAGYTAPRKSSTGDLTNKTNYTYLGQYGFSKYYLSKTRYSWKSARQSALDDGGDLAVFENKGEWDFVMREIRKSSGEWFWIGLYQTDKTREPKGNWSWVNGLPLEAGYTYNFGDNSGEPNNGGNNEDYGAGNEGSWVDVSESNNYYYVVEVDTRLDALQINYTDTALINGNRYFYRLRLKSASVVSSFSNILSARPNSGYPLPTNIKAVNASRNVRLSWTNPTTDKRGTGSYQIFRGGDSVNLKLITTVTDADSSFTDTSLLLGQTYFYRMKSIDGDGTESDFSAARSVKISAYLFVSSNGNDEAFGTEDTPLKTISQAMTKAQDGDTLILSRGNYLFLQTQRITKNVVIGSKYIITKDTADINETIISSSATIGSVFTASGSSARRHFIGLAFRNNQSIFNLENVIIDQCRFVANGSSSNPNNSFIGFSGNSTVRNSRFTGNYGTINLNNSGNTFVYNYFEGNIFGSRANTQATRFFSGWYGKLTIENNIFRANGQYVKQSWDEQETAIIAINGWGDTAFIANNSFLQNDAVAVVFQQSNKSAVVVNNLFYKNVSDFAFEKYNLNNNNNFIYSNISNNMLEKALSVYTNANSYVYSSDSKNNIINGVYGFKDTLQFGLGAASAAIAGGQHAFVVSGTPIYTAVLRDYYGNTRTSSKIDIGAEQTAFSFAAPSLNAEAGDKKVTLTWNRSSTRIRGYYIYRGTSIIADNVSSPTYTIPVRDSLSLVDGNLTNQTTYYYRIQAYDSAATPLRSGLSDNVAIVPNVPPAVPANVVGESGPRANLIRWTKAAGIKYMLFRGLRADSMAVYQRNIDTSFYIDRNVDAGKDYFYSLKAVDAGGASSDMTSTLRLRPNKTFYVDSVANAFSLGSSSSPMSSIQQAIDLSTDGDSVLVRAGTYRPFRISNKATIVRSIEGPYKTRVQSVSAADNYLIRVDGNQSDTRPYKRIVVEGFRLSGLSGWRTGSWNGVISVSENTSPNINNMIVSDMTDQQVFSVDQSAPIFSNFLIHNMRNAGLFNIGYSDSTQPENKVPKVFNATIFGFQGWFGGSGMDRSAIYLINSIVRNSNINNNAFPSHYIVRNSIVEFKEMDGKNGNMVVDPAFMNADSANFRLSSNSPALGIGVNRISIMGVQFNAPAFDLVGNARPAPSPTMPDLGAFENPFSFGAPTLDGEAGDKQVKLSWNRNSSRIKGYLVFRSTAPIPDTVTVSQYKIDRPDSLSLVDNSLTNATRYYFRIRGYDTSATPVLGAISNQISLIPNVPPAKPQELAGEAAARIMLLTWKKGAAGIKYTLFKGTKPDSLVVYRRDLDTTTFIDTAIVPGTNYHYAIKAVDPGGVASVFSDLVSLRASRTFYVDSLAGTTQHGTPKFPFAQIQLAINRAMAGDTVLVRPGTYEPFRIASKFLAVKSTAGPTRTHIQPTSIADFYLVRLENSGPYNYYDTTGNLSEASLVEGFTLSNYRGNRNGFWQGAIGVIQNSLVTFNNLIVTNMEDNIVLSIENSGPTFNNCLFYNLKSNFISLGYADSTIPKNKMPKFINSTFYGIQNWGFTNGSETALIPIVNSIIWGNIGNTSNQMSAKFFSVRNSIVQYPELASKNNNIKVDPQFLNEAQGDFRLSDFSPALGKGQTSFTVNGYTFGTPAFDIQGGPRPVPASTKPDLGIFENKYAFPAPTLTRLQRTGNQVKISFKADKSQPATKFTLHRSDSKAALDTITAVLRDVNKDSTTVVDQLPDGKLYYYVMRMYQGAVQSGNSNVISTVDTLYVPEVDFGNDTASVRFRAGANTLSFVNIAGEENTYPQVLAFDNNNKSANISNRSPNDSVFLIKTLKSNKAGQSVTLAVNRSMPVALGGAGDQMQILGPINLNFDDDFDFAAIYQKSGSNYTAANLTYDKGAFKFEQGSSLRLRFNQPGWLQLDSTVMPNFSFTAAQFENDPGSRNNPNIRDAVDMIDGNFDGKQEHIISVSQLKWVPKFKAVNTGNYVDVNRAMRIVGYADLNKDGTKDVIGVTGNNWAVGYNNAQGISVHFFISNTEVGLYELRRSNLFIDWNSALFIRDFDNDGRVDLLARGVNNSNYAIYSINPDYTFKMSNKVLGINSDDSKISVGDINNDGFIDVLSLSNNGILTVYLNDQRDAFKPRTYNVPFEFNQNTNMWSAFQLKVMDMNSDGLNDVVWAENLYNGSVFSDQILKVMIQSPEGEVKMSQSVSAANAKVEVSNDGYNVKIKWSGFTDALGGKLTYNFRLDTVNTYVNRMLYTGYNYQRTNPRIPIVLDQVVSSLYMDSVIYKDVNISSKYPYFIGVQAVNAAGRASDYKEVTFRPKDPLEKQISTLPGMTNARFAWGDYNNDGQLDLAVTGLGDENTGRILRIYKNENGKLVDLKLTNRQLSGGDVKWVDIDKDGWLDLLASGQSGSVPYVALFKNNAGTFEVSYPTSIPALKNSSMTLGDHDNNGTVDLVIVGQNAVGEAHAYLLNNDGRGNFTDVPDFRSKGILPGLYNADLKFIDYDLDGDLDLIYTGVDNAGNRQGGIRLNTLLDARETVNNNNQFFYSYGLNLKNARFDLGDADGDGDLDILVMGTDVSPNTQLERPITKLIKNLAIESRMVGGNNNNYGNMFNATSEMVIDSLNNGDVKFADINNDGLLDISITGLDVKNNPTTKIYISLGGFGNYSELKTLELPQFKNSAISWGDYNNDGNMDMVITGAKTVGAETVVYVNDQGTNKNAAPEVPTGLTITDLGLGRVVLKWAAPKDDHTTPKSLSYMIKLGTKPGLGDLSTIPVDSAGRLQSPTVPVIGANEYYVELPPGQYYWSVMAIDGNFKNSKFSKEQSFILKYPWKYVNQGGIIDRRLVPVENGQFAWADMNNDGLTDFIYLGNSGVGGTSPAGVFRNIGGSFVKVENTNGNGSSGLNSIDNIKNVSVKFKDINNDGFVDLFVAGENNWNSQPVFKAFINRRNFNFNDVTGVFNISTLLRAPSIDFADLDNNGSPDMIYSGTDNRGVGQVIFTTTRVDTANQTPPSPNGFTVSPFETNIRDILNKEQAQNINLAFTDFNLDKRIDMVVLYDNVDGLRKAEVYNGGLNEFGKNVFTLNAGINLPKVKFSTLDAVDFNKDGYPDLAISGYSSAGGQAFKIFRNAYDTAKKTLSFVDTQSDMLLPLQDGKTTWGDFNMDGYPDIIFSGNRTGSGYVTKMAATAVSAGRVTYAELPTFPFGDYIQLTPTMGDINGDGQLGVVLVGKENVNGSVTNAFKILQNVRGLSAKVPGQNGIVSGAAAPVQPMEKEMRALTMAAQEEQEYEHTLQTLGYSQQKIKLMMELAQEAQATDSEKFTENQSPDRPDSLRASILGRSGNSNLVKLSWKPSKDDLTPSSGLTYAMRIGRKPGRSDIMDPESNKDGIRKTPTSGNTENNFSWDVQLGSGTYYWAVQAVDASFSGSQFSKESVLIIRGDTIVNANAPSDILLNRQSRDTVYVPRDANTTTSRFRLSTYSVDSALVTSYTYAINEDDDPSVRNLFGIDTSNTLFLRSALDRSEYDLRLITTDSRGISFEKPLKFIVVEAPSNILLDGVNTSVLNITSGVDSAKLNVVLTGVDAKFSADKLSYSLIDGEGSTNNAMFSIKDGNKLFNRAPIRLIDTLRIRVAVSNGFVSFEKQVRIISSCTFPSVKFTNSRTEPFRICEGDTVTLNLAGTAATVNVFRDNNLEASLSNTNQIRVTKPGKYYAIYATEAASQCGSKTDSVFVQYNVPLAEVSVNGNQTTICANRSTTLTAVGATGYTYQWLQDNKPITGATGLSFNASAAGEYRVRVTNAQNCSSVSGGVRIAVLPAPDATLSIRTDTTICQGTTLNISVPSGAAGYVWTRNGVQQASGSNVFNFVGTGNLSVTVTGANGCVASSNVRNITTAPNPTAPAISVLGTTSICPGSRVLILGQVMSGVTYQWLRDGQPITGATEANHNAAAAGVYQLQVTNQNRCFTRSESVTMRLGTAPAKPTVSRDQADMVSSATSGNQWFSQGEAIPGATDQRFRPATNGYYTVRTTNTDGCVSTMSDVFFYLATSIVNLGNEQYIKLFPNPVVSGLNLEYKISGVAQLNVRIYDASGRLVFERSGVRTGANLNVGGLIKGLYLIKVTRKDGREIYNGKMIKE